MGGRTLAVAAESLVGSRFRLHGRDPATGLDCIGLLAAALEKIGLSADFPTGYRIRTGVFAGLHDAACRHGFEAAGGALAAGDVLFTVPGPAQLHLVIAGNEPDHFIEAHAGIGRVVIRPGPLRDPILEHWRLTAPN